MNSFLNCLNGTLMMDKALAVVVVLGLVLGYTYAGQQYEDCSDVNTHHLKDCDFLKVCVWTKCRCYAGKPGCQLQCSWDPRKRCNGLKKGQSCSMNPDYPAYCKKSKLSCVFDEQPIQVVV